MGESMRERRFLTVLEILGMTLCFLGLAVLFLPELLGASVLSSYFLGYLAAGLAALSWTTYSILCRESYNSEGFDRSMSLDILLSGIVFTILHSCIGTWSLPNPSTSLVIVIFSVLCYGIAFPFWRRSLQLGHYSFVSGLANMIPILSVFWLVLGGIVSFSVGLVYATLLVSLGCYFLNQQSYKQQESFVRLKIKTKMVLNK
jgi:drug/metabolite transporter (DMT)-like permease